MEVRAPWHEPTYCSLPCQQDVSKLITSLIPQTLLSLTHHIHAHTHNNEINHASPRECSIWILVSHPQEWTISGKWNPSYSCRVLSPQSIRRLYHYQGNTGTCQKPWVDMVSKLPCKYATSKIIIKGSWEDVISRRMTIFFWNEWVWQ